MPPPDPILTAQLPFLKRRWLRIYAPATLAIGAAGGVAFNFWQPRKRVVLMDSPLPEVVYDKEAAVKGQTNATAIAELLKDLSVTVMKGSTDVEWNREVDVLSMEPHLIILHGSAFYSRTNCTDSAGKLRSFLERMVDTRPALLIYTRVPVEGFTRALDTDRIRRQMAIGRLRFWQVPGADRASFRDPATRRELIRIVKEMLQ